MAVVYLTHFSKSRLFRTPTSKNEKVCECFKLRGISKFQPVVQHIFLYNTLLTIFDNRAILILAIYTSLLFRRFRSFIFGKNFQKLVVQYAHVITVSTIFELNLKKNSLFS